MANWEKIINLIKKTGDKIVILDNEGEPGYVVMSLNDYEKLVLGRSEVQGLTDQELLAKINRDIALWKDSQKINDLAPDQYDFSADLGEFAGLEEEPEAAVDDDRYYFEPVE